MAALRVKPTPVPLLSIAVAEDHRLHVDRGAELVADALAYAIGDRAGAVPAAEHGFDRAAQLLDGILRERLAGVLLDDRLVRLAQLLERACRNFGVGLHAGVLLGELELVIERLARNVQHDAAVHRDEAAVAVVREPLVVGDGRQTLHALVVETEVEDRVHHARHAELGAGTNAHEQRIGRVARGRASSSFRAARCVWRSRHRDPAASRRACTPGTRPC